MPTTVIASIMSIKNSLPEDAEFVVFVVVEVVVSEVVAEVAVVEVVVVDSASEAELLLLFLFTTKLVPRPKREKFFIKTFIESISNNVHLEGIPQLLSTKSFESIKFLVDPLGVTQVRFGLRGPKGDPERISVTLPPCLCSRGLNI